MGSVEKKLEGGFKKIDERTEELRECSKKWRTEGRNDEKFGRDEEQHGEKKRVKERILKNGGLELGRKGWGQQRNDGKVEGRYVDKGRAVGRDLGREGGRDVI